MVLIKVFEPPNIGCKMAQGIKRSCRGPLKGSCSEFNSIPNSFIACASYRLESVITNAWCLINENSVVTTARNSYLHIIFFR